MKSISSRLPALTSADLAGIFVAVIWGANFAVVKVAFDEFPPLVFNAFRFGISSTLMLFILYRLEGIRLVSRRRMLQLFVLGIIGNTFYQATFIIGLDITTAANSAMILAAIPVMVAVLGALLGIEQMNRYTRTGIIITFIGLVLVLAVRGVNLTDETLPGDLLILLGTFFWASYTVGIRGLKTSMSPLYITTITMVIGTPGIVLMAWGDLQTFDMAQISIGGWSGLLYSAVLAIVVGYVLWNVNIQRVGSNRTALYNTMMPIVAVIVAWWALGEQPTLVQLVGVALILSGVLYMRREKQIVPPPE